MLVSNITNISALRLTVPTPENTLLLFVAHLAMSGLAHTSIKVYFSSIGNLHSSCSQHDAYHIALTPRLEQVLHGIKRKQASTLTKRVRLPITAEIMQQVYSVLSRPPSEYRSTILWAARCTAFFGFLQVREMAIPSLDAYDYSVHLSLGDVALDSRTAPNHHLLSYLAIQKMHLVHCSFQRVGHL